MTLAVPLNKCDEFRTEEEMFDEVNITNVTSLIQTVTVIELRVISLLIIISVLVANNAFKEVNFL